MNAREEMGANSLTDDLEFERVFSLKEALFKALYPLTGLMFDFLDAEIVEISSNGQARLRLLRDLGSRWHAGKTINAHHAAWSEVVYSVVAINTDL